MPSTLVLNLAPFWHNSSCWELRETRWRGEKGKEERDDVSEGDESAVEERNAGSGGKEEEDRK